MVRRLMDSLHRPDAGALELFDADVEFDVSRDIWGTVMGGGIYRGPAGVRQWLRDLYGAWGVMDLRYEELTDAGDQVLCALVARGRGRTSGAEVEHRATGVWTVREGKIVQVTWFSSRAEALEAVGLSE